MRKHVRHKFASGPTTPATVFTLGVTVARQSPEWLGLTCATCGSKRIIALNFDQAERIPPDERPIHKCVGCGVRIFKRKPPP